MSKSHKSSDKHKKETTLPTWSVPTNSDRLNGVVQSYDPQLGRGTITSRAGSIFSFQSKSVVALQSLTVGQAATFHGHAIGHRGGWEAFDIVIQAPASAVSTTPTPTLPPPTQNSAEATPIKPAQPSTSQDALRAASAEALRRLQGQVKDNLAPRVGERKSTIVEPAQSSISQDAIHAAAAEALQRLRERDKGNVAPRIVEFPVGAEVWHPTFGHGKVLVAIANVRTVQFNEVTRDLHRKELRAGPVELETKTSESHVTESRRSVDLIAPKVLPPARSGNSIRTFMDHFRRMAQINFEKMGIDSSRIYQMEDGREPLTEPTPLDIDPLVANAFASAEKIEKFYSHQHAARNELQLGRHIVLCTPTASGKTACFNPTILETLLHDREATALYVFPLNALSFDQHLRLRKLNEALPPEHRVTLAMFNSTVDPMSKREQMRSDNRIVVTTPETLHYQLLPKPYPNWRRFFRNLKYIVLDEAHVYKGVFGSNMANIVRRVLVRARREGAPRFPQVILSSATVRSPKDLAKQLTGLPSEDFAVIDESGARQPRRHSLIDHRDVMEVCADLLEAETIDVITGKPRPVRMIVFMKSVREVKQRTAELRKQLSHSGRSDETKAIADYYGDKSDKTDLLLRLKDGQVRCLFTTIALMAGIDIGGLDISIVCGFPGLVMDVRQMFGRAGRAGEGAAIFLANLRDPFDQFYLERPDLLFNGPLQEEVVCNPDNPFLLAAHLLCASNGRQVGYSQEGPLPGEYIDLFGETGRDLVEGLVERGQLQIHKGACYLPPGPAPHDLPPLDSLRAIQGQEYKLQDTEGTELEKKQQTQAFRDAHLGAIFYYDGTTYRVIDFNHQDRVIKCRPTGHESLRTQGNEQTLITVLPEQETRLTEHGFEAGSGELKVRTQVSSYGVYQLTEVKRCRRHGCGYETTNTALEVCPKCKGRLNARQSERFVQEMQLPPEPALVTDLDTWGSWFEVPVVASERFERLFWPRWNSTSSNGTAQYCWPDFPSAVQSAKHAILKVYPEIVRCDRDDIRGTAQQKDDLTWRIWVYDNFPGGLAISARLFNDPGQFLEAGLTLIEQCTCTHDLGCPVCLQHVHYRRSNQLISKLAGRFLLRSLLGLPLDAVLGDLEGYAAMAVPASDRVSGPAGASKIAV